MASRTHPFFQSPLRVSLIAHAMSVVATLALLLAGLVQYRHDPSGTGWLWTIGGILTDVTSGGGGAVLLYIVLGQMEVLAMANFVLGLIYGRWGLPGHLQGRAVFVVPVLAAVYFVVGRQVLASIDAGGITAGWAGTRGLLTTWAGLTLVLLYALLSAAATGVGWAAALAITRYMRLRGKWETIGYVPRRLKGGRRNATTILLTCEFVAIALSLAGAALFFALRGMPPNGDVRCASQEDVAGLQRCLSWGYSINTVGVLGDTPLHEAASQEIAKLLVSRGAEVDARDKLGRTPLHDARTGAIAVFLISEGADVNAKDSSGWTPLHSAVLWDNTETAAVLIAKGADVNARDKEGRTPLTIAIEESYDNLADLLRRHGAKE